jgi:hypothetical protein
VAQAFAVSVRIAALRRRMRAVQTVPRGSSGSSLRSLHRTANRAVRARCTGCSRKGLAERLLVGRIEDRSTAAGSHEQR